jgi:hypothetical protein
MVGRGILREMEDREEMRGNRRTLQLRGRTIVRSHRTCSTKMLLPDSASESDVV